MVKRSALGYWSRTRLVAIAVLVLLMVYSIGFPLFAAGLGGTLGRFSLAFVLASQGALLGLVVAVFWFARRQRAIDREFAVAEEE